MLRLLSLCICLITLVAMPVYGGEVEPSPRELDTAAEQSAQAIRQAKELQDDPAFYERLQKQTRESLEAAQKTFQSSRSFSLFDIL